MPLILLSVVLAQVLAEQHCGDTNIGQCQLPPLFPIKSRKQEPEWKLRREALNHLPVRANIQIAVVATHSSCLELETYSYLLCKIAQAAVLTSAKSPS